MSDLVGNPEDRFSQNEAHIMSCLNTFFESSRETHMDIQCLAIRSSIVLPILSSEINV